MREDLLDPRLTEQRNSATVDIDRADVLGIIDLINAEDRRVPDAVASQREEIARAIEIGVDCLGAGGRIIYVGAGSSGRLGVLDAAECPPTFGSDPDLVQGIIAGGYLALVRSQEGAEDRADEAEAAIDDRGVGPDDFVLGIAASSTTPFVRRALERARERGARTGFLCCTEPEPELRAAVEVCIVPLVGPEVIAGSTRMKAGTATKLVLNTISTGVMIRLGKVYQNLMVDLGAASDKLVDRGERIVMALSDVSRDEARAAIGQAEGSVRKAVVMTLAGVDRPLAEVLLAEAGGFVRGALERCEAVRRTLREQADAYAAYSPNPPNADTLDLTLDALRRAPRRISDLVRSVPPELLRARPAPDKWCANEQIEHLIAFDQVMQKRLRLIMEEDEPALPDFDESVENPKVFESEAREAVLSVLLRRIADARASLMARVDAQPPGAFERAGHHERHGRLTAYQLLRHLAAHDDHHIRAIRRLVGGEPPR